MPEGDTIFRAARTLQKALGGKTVTRFESVLPKLSRVDHDHPLKGRTVESVSAKGKHLLMHFSGGLWLRTHMRMNGSWHVYRPGEAWQRGRFHMRIVLETADFVAVGFDIPIADFFTDRELERETSLQRLGPDTLSEDFDVEEVIRRLQARGAMETGDAMLDQSALAGVGNVFKSEVCFSSGVNPFTKVRLLTPDQLRTLTLMAQKMLRANVSENLRQGVGSEAALRKTTSSDDPSARLHVYGRGREPCRRCGTPVEFARQGIHARVTYWCPHCQPLVTAD